MYFDFVAYGAFCSIVVLLLYLVELNPPLVWSVINRNL